MLGGGHSRNGTEFARSHAEASMTMHVCSHDTARSRATEGGFTSEEDRCLVRMRRRRFISFLHARRPQTHVCLHETSSPQDARCCDVSRAPDGIAELEALSYASRSRVLFSDAECSYPSARLLEARIVSVRPRTHECPLFFDYAIG